MENLCVYYIGYEMIERMAYYGIVSNLVLYLTKKLHEGTVKSSNHVTNWAGTVWIMPAAGAYIADAYLGRYWTFLISSAIYFLVTRYSILIRFSISCVMIFDIVNNNHIN
jgi:peptide/histidine transporter 3/4